MSWRHGGNGSTPTDGTPMRKINGPLGDLWKKRTKSNQQPHDLTLHDALGLEEHTEFEHGPWIEMCQFMGIAATEGQVNGGVDLGRLPMNTEQVALGFQSTGVIEQDFMLLIRTSKYVDEEIVATFHDPLGCIDGYFHRDVVDSVGAALVKGTAVILRNVTVFMPVERRQQYLNICRSNIVRVFPSSSQYAEDLDAFNGGQAAVVGPPAAGASPFVLEDPSGEATTAADLVAMTQRHVINQSHAQRAPPTGGHKGKQKWAWKSFVPKKKKKKQQGQEEESPLQPSPASSASPVSPSPLPPRPAAKPRRTPTFESPPPPARPQPPAALPPAPVARHVIPPAQPSSPVPIAKTVPVAGKTQKAPPPAPIAKSFPAVDKTPAQPRRPAPKPAPVGPGDAISLAVDAALDDDDW